MMNPYKDIEAGKPIRVSGWGLYHVDSRAPVLSGDCVYNNTSAQHHSIIVTNGKPPQASRDRGLVWCPRWYKEFKPRPYGLKWVKLDSEGEPLF